MDIKWSPEKGKKLMQKIMAKDRLVIILLVGILLVVIAIPTKEKSGHEENVTEEAEVMTEDSDRYTEYIERHLENVLSKVEGVGKVEVMLTLKTSAEKVIEKDKETSGESVKEEDSQGGVRTTLNNSSSETTVYTGEDESIANDGGGQTPYVIKEISPEVEGVIVIAEGGDNPVVIQNISEAVQALFGVDTHKIKIMKLNQN